MKHLVVKYVFVELVLMLVTSSQGTFIHQGGCAFVRNMPWFPGTIHSPAGGNTEYSFILFNGSLLW